MSRNFDGINDQIDSGVNWNLNASQPFLCGCVLRSDITYAGTDWAALIGDDASANEVFELAIGNAGGGIGADNKGFIFNKYASSTTHWANTTVTLDDGLWHSIVGGRNGGGDPIICCDGETIVKGAVARTNSVATATSIHVGDRKATSFPFDGQIANAFYDRGSTFTDAEIERLSAFLLNFWLTDGALFGWRITEGFIYPLEGIHSPEADWSGLGNGGTVTGATRDANPQLVPFSRRLWGSVPLIEVAPAGEQLLEREFPRGVGRGLVRGVA